MARPIKVDEKASKVVPIRSTSSRRVVVNLSEEEFNRLHKDAVETGTTLTSRTRAAVRFYLLVREKERSKKKIFVGTSPKKIETELAFI